MTQRGAPRLADALIGLLAPLATLAEADPGREVCGFVLRAADGAFSLRPARNAAPDPSRHFEVDVRDLLAVHRSARDGGAAVSAVYHSHPAGGAALSPTDRAALLLDDGSPLLPGVELLVVGLCVGKVGEVRLHGWCGPGTFAEVARAVPLRTVGEERGWVISTKLP